MKFVDWLGIARAKFYEWRRRYGKVNEHNAKIPRDHWTELRERQAIIDYFDQHPLEGYRRLTFMMRGSSAPQKWRGEAASRPDACGAPLHLVGGVTGPGGHRRRASRGCVVAVRRAGQGGPPVGRQVLDLRRRA